MSAVTDLAALDELISRMDQTLRVVVHLTSGPIEAVIKQGDYLQLQIMLKHHHEAPKLGAQFTLKCANGDRLCLLLPHVTAVRVLAPEGK